MDSGPDPITEADLDRLCRALDNAPDMSTRELLFSFGGLPVVSEDVNVFYNTARLLLPLLLAETARLRGELKDLASDYAGLEALDAEAQEGANEMRRENAGLRAALQGLIDSWEAGMSFDDRTLRPYINGFRRVLAKEKSDELPQR